MMQYQSTLDLWLARAVEDPDLAAELEAVRSDPDAVTDRFYRDLAFGTGGLRGVIGAGTNRMNLYTVRRATQGLADYLNASGLPKKVAIAHDSRRKGELFCREAARVLAANGITAYLYPRLEPTPALSWATRYLGCGAGICVTASHNPAKYNGYKVYGPDGGQITLEAAEHVQAAIDSTDPFDGVALADFDAAVADGRIRYIPEQCLEDFLDAVQKLSLSGGAEDLSVVYTPLNGSGLECVTKILGRIGVKDVTVVPEQEHPDGRFPTCPYPNPEIREAMELGIQYAKKNGSDLLLATDPDCDRVGIAVRDGEEYVLLSANEVGLLLFEYICERRIALGRMPERPLLMKTIVTMDHVKAIADHYHVQVIDVLTGFKFIGEQIGLLEQRGELERYIFGFEESYGYLSGTFVRDKDGVNASLLICEMYAYYKAQGRGLLEVLNDLYDRYGYCLNTLYNFQFEGAAGFEKMQGIMDDFRQNSPAEAAGLRVVSVEDYQAQEKRFADGRREPIQGLPKSNVLKFWLEGGCSFVVRPSGTEPKLKIYLSVSGNGRERVRALENRLAEELRKRIEG